MRSRERGTEEHGSEDDERHGREDGAGLLHELRDVAAAMSSQPAEDRAADERGDEPGASDRLGQREGEERSGERNDLEPRLVDEAPAAGVDDDRGSRRARDDAAQHAVSDLLGHELGGVAVSDRSFLRQRDGERDEEERHADPVVEATLDVEALTDSDRKATRRDDDLTERGIGRREDDREHESFGPREVAEERDCGDEPGDDRERKPDPEQPRRNAERRFEARCRSMRDASEKRTTVSVASASVLTSSPVAAGSTRSSASTPTTRPAAVKNMGAVIHVPSMRREIAAKTRRTTASVTSCQCTGGASQRAAAR